MNLNRTSGILLHISSLPSSYGIGDLGKNSYLFIDLLKKMNQSLWQILPLNTVDEVGSPYKSYSAFAGNFLLIDPDDLLSKKLISKKNLKDYRTKILKEDAKRVDYKKVLVLKEKLLKTAFEKFDVNNHDFCDFKNKNKEWLLDWSLYITIAQKTGEDDWTKWKLELRDRNNKAIDKFSKENLNAIEFHNFVQFIFFDQWSKLKEYADTHGIKIIGDIPIFVSFESSDVWSRPWEYNLDLETKRPLTIAGVPPDYFSKTGQLWGNPHYNWDAMRDSFFEWWKKRFEFCFNLYDIVRVDHFRGFEAYWVVDGNETVATNGYWKKAPGWDLFNTLQYHFGGILPILVEDLGAITEEVYRLRDHFSFPGTRLFQHAFSPPDGIIHLRSEMGPEAYRRMFGFDEDNVHRIEHYSENSVVYTGTHDNNTIKGWFEEDLVDSERQYVLNYCGGTSKEINWSMIKKIMSSRSKISLIPFQDILDLGSEGRMNTPGVSEGNWVWRFSFDQITPDNIERMKEITLENRRC